MCTAGMTDLSVTDIAFTPPMPGFPGRGSTAQEPGTGANAECRIGHVPANYVLLVSNLYNAWLNDWEVRVLVGVDQPPMFHSPHEFAMLPRYPIPWLIIVENLGPSHRENFASQVRRHYFELARRSESSHMSSSMTKIMCSKLLAPFHLLVGLLRARRSLFFRGLCVSECPNIVSCIFTFGRVE